MAKITRCDQCGTEALLRPMDLQPFGWVSLTVHEPGNTPNTYIQCCSLACASEWAFQAVQHRAPSEPVV